MRILKKNGRQYFTLQVCLPRELAEWVEQQAAANNRSVSRWLRLLIKHEQKHQWYRSLNL